MGQIGIFGKLLGYCGTALGNGSAANVCVDGAQYAFGVNPRVLIEAVIFHGHKSVPQMYGDLGDFHGHTVFRRMDIGKLYAVGIVYGGCGRWSYVVD